MKRKKDLEKELESQYGKIILFSFAQYWGGHKREIAGGKINDFSLGIMYLFENYFLFRVDVAQQENYREILIPIKSIITDDWNPENLNDESSVEGIKVFEDNNGIVKKKFVVPFIDKDGIKQKPIFSIIGNFAPKKAVGVASWWGGGGITKWMQVFYDVILKSKEKLAESIEVNYDIEKWIKEWEGPTLEFKRADILDESFKLARSMVALGNNKSEKEDVGGRIVIGINNETHTIEGVKSKSKHEEHIMNVGRDRCKPPIIPIFKKINHKGKTLYVISIPKMKNVPYQLKTKDGYIHLIRVGSTIRDPHPEEIAELYGKSKSHDEKIRDAQVMQKLVKNFESLKEKMDHLKGIAISKQLVITQFKDYVDGKNQIVDETKQMVADPLTVLDDKLKRDVIRVLDLCRYKPAWESIEPALKMTMQRKMLDNGWSKDAPDFNVNSRFVDNNTDDAIKAIIDILNEFRNLSQSGEQD